MGIKDLPRENIFQPEHLRLRVCPGVDGVAAEAVNDRDTKVRLRLAKLTGHERQQLADLQERLNSIAGDVAASLDGIQWTVPYREQSQQVWRNKD